MGRKNKSWNWMKNKLQVAQWLSDIANIATTVHVLILVLFFFASSRSMSDPKSTTPKPKHS